MAQLFHFVEKYSLTHTEKPYRIKCKQKLIDLIHLLRENYMVVISSIISLYEDKGILIILDC